MIFLRMLRENSVADFNTSDMPKGLIICKTALLDAPMIIGLIRPVLYLPQAEIGYEELNYIILHELTHYKRHDILYKWFAMLVSFTHWFNSFIYIVSKQINEECEIYCDMEICKKLTAPQKKDYMNVILALVQISVSQNRPLSTQMASNKKLLERRFMIIKTKKATNKSMSAFSITVAFTMICATAFASSALSGTEGFINAPVLRENVTYIPYSCFEFLLYAAGLSDRNIDYSIYDINGKKISFGGFYDNAENLSKYDLENLQNEADNGHYPWRLDPQGVYEQTKLIGR